MKRNLILHLIFAIIVIIELIGRLTDNIAMEYPVKPLIMIWMAIYFLLNRRKDSLRVPVMLAFFFSWVGDNLLMLSGENEMLFYAGVGGFFCAQIVYIYIFSTFSESTGSGFVQRTPAIIFLFFLYLAGVYIFLAPGLEGIMKPIIIVYAISLIAMSVMALNRNGRVNYPSFILTFSGSLLFVLSDSLIALNKFSFAIPQGGFLIMITYIAAQYLIMRGLILEQ